MLITVVLTVETDYIHVVVKHYEMFNFKFKYLLDIGAQTKSEIINVYLSDVNSWYKK